MRRSELQPESGALSINRREFVSAVAASALAFSPAGQNEEGVAGAIECPLYPALPDGLEELAKSPWRLTMNPDEAVLDNGFARFNISLSSGLLRAVTNKLTDEAFAVSDLVGLEVRRLDGSVLRVPSDLPFPGFQTDHKVDRDSVFLTLTSVLPDAVVTISYHGLSGAFWLERRIQIEPRGPGLRLEQLAYGRFAVTPGQVKVLELGKFDRPRLSAAAKGGLFAGLGWWLYQVDNQATYENREMDFDLSQTFVSEPWYVGVFRKEEREPYPGWLWYRSFLQSEKSREDRQAAWSYWNAGWGQWGIDIDDPSAQKYLPFVSRLGIASIAFGSGGAGKGIPAYVEIVKSSPAAGANVALMKENKIEFGFLENGGLGEKWQDDAAVEAKLRLLEECTRLGIRAMHFDFFSSVDTFRAHHNVTRYFRACRRLLEYTECHLGMAAYGPQFQRLVLLNHPTDLHGFDISHFSSDWTTFLGFRQSRREWQQRYDYLMPEYGLYYYLTHYSNWGHPRLYRDPEPQQFLYGPHAYCGIGYNFHDLFGFQMVIAAASAFTPFFVFGHLELTMPESEIRFAREYMVWVKENASILRRSRVCFETSDLAVVSKVQDGKGLVFIINYAPSSRLVRLGLKGLGSPGEVNLVFPERRRLAPKSTGLDLAVPGESVAIIDIGRSLSTFPPLPSPPLVVEPGTVRWLGASADLTFDLPKLAGGGKAEGQPMPERLLSLDDLGQSASGILTEEEAKQADKTVSWIGRGKLPARFREVFEFKDGTAPTDRFVPWAFGDRIWLVFRPDSPSLLSHELPALTVNGKEVRLYPRVDYRPKQVEQWSCPLFFADVTGHVKAGRRNSVRIAGLSRPGGFVSLATRLRRIE